MKIIESIITYEDYNYVEGDLELKFTGSRIDEVNNTFSVDKVISAKLYVIKKHVSPNIPAGINCDRVFWLQLPRVIPTFVNDNGNIVAYNVSFDKIICDDNFVSQNGKLKINRYNTTQDQGETYSTLTVKVYGLKKTKREELEERTFYELFPTITGDGQIEITPEKEYYAFGERVNIKALPDKYCSFVKWGEDFVNQKNQDIEITIEKDTFFEAVFTTVSDYHGSLLNTIFIDAKGAYNNHYYSAEKENNGCFSSILDGISILFRGIGALFLAFIAISIILSVLSIFGWNSLWILLSIAVLWLLPKSMQFLGNSAFIQHLFSLIFIGLIIASLYNLINIKDYISATSEVDAVPTTQQIINDNTSIDYVHHISWFDSSLDYYEINLKVNSDNILYEYNIKQSYPSINTVNQYNSLLSRLYIESEESLYQVYMALDSLKSTYNISDSKLPDVIVSMVQSIQYYAIADNTCNPFSYQDESIRQLLLNNPCQGYIKHGLKSPAEFLQDLKADCDSRTLFLYTILKHYNYDVAILGSEHYKHSLLGINTENELTDATYKLHNNKKYYLWETTSAGYKLGEIPIQLRNINLWSFNLL